MNFKIRRKFIIVVIISAFVLVIPLLLLSFHAPVRMLALSATKGVYEVQRRYVLERYLIEPNFAIIAGMLNDQIDTIKSLGSSKPRLSAEFIETVGLVMANVRFQDEYAELKPVLARLAALEPKSYLPQYWHAQAALELGDPNASKLIEAAILLMPADDRAYRLAYRLAVGQSDEQRISQICNRWRNAHFGGLKFPKHYAKRSGATQRRMTVQGITSNGHLVIASNLGINSGSQRRYAFRFDEKVLDHEFVLRLAVFPGTRLTLHKVELLYPEGWKTVPEGSIQIMPSHGFFDRTGGLILSHRGEQTVHFVSTHEASGGSVTENSVGGIALEATFTKLELGLDPNCKA